MMQYCRLKSDVKVCSLFQLGVEDDFILLNERIEGIFDVLRIDGCESYPVKYTSTWKKNIILLDSEKNALYNDISRPHIKFIDENKIVINYRNKEYELLYDEIDMVFPKNSKVKIMDPTHPLFQMEGTIIEVIADRKWLEAHDFIPSYRLNLNSNMEVFVDHYQIDMIQ